MKAQGVPSKTAFEVVPEGVYKARIFYLVDLGTQEDKNIKTQEVKFTRKVRIVYELPTKLMSDGRPFAVGRDYNMNLGSAPKPGRPAPGFSNPLLDVIYAFSGYKCPTNLDGYYEYELDKLMGKCAMLSVIHNENGNAKIKGVYPLEDGAQVPEPVNTPVLLSLEPSEFNRKVYEDLSDYWQAIILKSPEGNAAVNGVAPAKAEAPPAADESWPEEDSLPF